jgi:hypothetical protein
MPVPAGYRLLAQFPMPMPSGLHKWFFKKLPCPHGMTKSQYPANTGINLTDGLRSLCYNARKDSFPCNNQSWKVFFILTNLSHNFALCWGGATTNRVSSAISLDIALRWGLRCQVASSDKGIFARFLLFRAVFLVFWQFPQIFSPFKLKSSVGSLPLMLNLWCYDCHQWHITKMKETKHWLLMMKFWIFLCVI